MEKEVKNNKRREPLGKDGLRRKTVRLDNKEHTMAKTVYGMEGFETMQEYMESLIIADVQKKYPGVYKKIKGE